jgi:hypothetical protein
LDEKFKKREKEKRKNHFWRQKKLKKPSRDEFLFLAFWQTPATTHVNNYFWQGRQDTQHNGTQHFDTIMGLCYAECRYVECRGARRDHSIDR